MNSITNLGSNPNVSYATLSLVAVAVVSSLTSIALAIFIQMKLTNPVKKNEIEILNKKLADAEKTLTIFKNVIPVGKNSDKLIKAYVTRQPIHNIQIEDGLDTWYLNVSISTLLVKDGFLELALDIPAKTDPWYPKTDRTIQTMKVALQNIETAFRIPD